MVSKRWLTRGGNRRRVSFEALEARRVLASLAGTVYEDTNGNRLLDDGERPLSGVVVFLDANSNGQLDQAGFGLEPDLYRHDEVLNNSQQSVFPSGTGVDNLPASRVRALDSPSRATTGQRVFGNDRSVEWGFGQRLRFDFTLPAESVSLDAIGTSAIARANVVLEAYSRTDALLARQGIENLSNIEPGRLEIVRDQPDIAYVVAYVATDRGAATFDNLRVNDVEGERSTLTSDGGFYRFLDLPPGQYEVAQVTPAAFEQTAPAPEPSYVVQLDGSISQLNFGNRTASVSGIAFEDVGTVGVYEPSRDDVLAGTPLYLDTNSNGSPDPIEFTLDPDAFIEEQVLDFASTHVRLSTADSNNQITQEAVLADHDDTINPDGQLFSHEGDFAWSGARRLRMDFETPASNVSIDFLGALAGETEIGTLVAYSLTGQELQAVTTGPLSVGELETLSIEREGFDISYAVAYTKESIEPSGRLDNLRATVAGEPVVITDADGNYQFTPLAMGTSFIRPLPVSDHVTTFPELGFYDPELEFGDEEFELNFGFVIGNESPVAKGDRALTTEDGPVEIDVLANDFDPDGSLDFESVTILQEPRHGTAEATLAGTIFYTPDEDFVGTDTLIYTVRDDQLAESNSAVVTITVVAVNDAPVAEDDAASIVGPSTTIIGVLRNDVDVDDGLAPATVTIVAAPLHGTAEVDVATGNIIYATTEPNSDSFSYTVDDVNGLTSNVATVTIVVLAEGTAPIARDDELTAPEGTKTTLTVLVNDSDDSRVDPNGIVIVTPPAHGVAAAMADGTIEYVPDLGFVGEDRLEYLVRDDVGLASNVAAATIAISAREFPYQNPLQRLDVNADGFIIPRDALLIINEINDRQFSDEATGQIVVTPEPGQQPVAYFDVTGDGFVVARDVLQIVNFLNGDVAAAEPVEDPSLAAAAAFADFASDADDEDDDEFFV